MFLSDPGLNQNDLERSKTRSKLNQGKLRKGGKEERGKEKKVERKKGGKKRGWKGRKEGWMVVDWSVHGMTERRGIKPLRPEESQGTVTQKCVDKYRGDLIRRSRNRPIKNSEKSVQELIYNDPVLCKDLRGLIEFVRKLWNVKKKD